MHHHPSKPYRCIRWWLPSHRSIFITQALFELALLTQQDLDSIRDEVNAALESEGGWNKMSLLKFRKIDSTLREVGRVYGLMHCNIPFLIHVFAVLKSLSRLTSGCLARLRPSRWNNDTARAPHCYWYEGNTFRPEGLSQSRSLWFVSLCKIARSWVLRFEVRVCHNRQPRTSLSCDHCWRCIPDWS